MGKKIGGCNQLDIPCVCKSGDFIGTIACCVKDNCNEDDQKKVLEFADGVCGSVGVDTPDTPGGIAALCKDDKGGSSSKTASQSGAAATTSASQSGTSKTDQEPAPTSSSGAGLTGASGALGALAVALMAL